MTETRGDASLCLNIVISIIGTSPYCFNNFLTDGDRSSLPCITLLTNVEAFLVVFFYVFRKLVYHFIYIYYSTLKNISN